MLDDSNGIGSFARVPNTCIRDKRLKPADKGIYSYICSCSANFTFSEATLAKNLGVGKSSVHSSMVRLMSLGYVEKVRYRTGKGKFGKMLCVAKPFPLFVDVDMESPSADNPPMDNPTVEKTDDIIILSLKNINETILNGITPDYLTSDLALFENRVLHRPLTLTELPIWDEWREKRVDPHIILRAVVDNEFRRRNLTLHNVQDTIKTWEENGLKTYKDIENYLLDKLYENIVQKAKNENPYGTDSDIEATVSKTNASNIHNWRDEMRIAFMTRQYNDLQYMLNDCPTEVFRYLPNELLEYAAEYYKRRGKLDKRDTCLSFVEGGKAYA